MPWSKKAERRFVLGIAHKPCGRFVFDFRVSEHVLVKYKLPKAWKNAASDCLEMNQILGDDFRKYGIDFVIDKVTMQNPIYADSFLSMLGFRKI